MWIPHIAREYGTEFEMVDIAAFEMVVLHVVALFDADASQVDYS